MIVDGIMIAGQMAARTGSNKVQTKPWQPENAAGASKAPAAQVASGATAAAASSAPASMPAAAPAEKAAAPSEIQAASAAQ